MDSRSDPKAATIAAYDAGAAGYAAARTEADPVILSSIHDFAARLGYSGRVLEIGSGSGRDALAMEAAGLDVDRTDISSGFVEILRAAGQRAVLLDPLIDDFPAIEYDGVWAQACLLHVSREDLPRVLRRLRRVTRPGGWLYASVKAGVGEGWSTHGAVADPRHFTYWTPDAWRGAVTASGWRIETFAVEQRRDTWLETFAVHPVGQPHPHHPESDNLTS